MSNRAKLLTAGGAAGVVLVVFAIWFFVFRDDAPAAVNLDDAVGSVTSTTRANTPTTTGTADPESLDGTWMIDTTVGGGVVEQSSFVGYRVQEELASIGAKTAVGRTTALSGEFTFEDRTLTAGEVVVDMTQLTSDSRGRDGQMRTQALETNAFPEASFVLTEPVELAAAPEPESSFMANATGDLTIHGVTQSVTVPIQGQRIGDTIVVVGSIEILFADYQIERPRAAVVLSVEEQGEMEFQLFLTRA